MRATNLPGFPIHWTAETVANGRRLRLWNQFGERFPYLLANSSAPSRAVNYESAAVDDFRRLIADDDLQLRATDFKAEEVHAGGGIILKRRGVSSPLRYISRAFRTLATNSRASRVSSGQLPSRRIDCWTSKDPRPTASHPAFRNSPTSSGLAMPVGMIRK